MVPKMVIVAIGKSTHVFFEGKEIADGVGDLIYSAKNSSGELSPTLKLMEVDIRNFSFEKGRSLEEFLKAIGDEREMFSGINADGSSTPDGD